jgi:hypothetical protein
MHFEKKSLAVAVSLAVAPLAALAAPTISWVAPSSGANLYGAYSESRVGCEISGSGISRVKFYVDSREMNSDYGSPWRCVIDTRNFSLGTHTLKALAIGSDGTTASITRSVNFVSSSSGTTTTTTTSSNLAPSVTLTAPASGQTVSGTIALSAMAADDKAVSRVVFSVDSTTLATDTASPFSASLNTTTLANGTHTLKAQAFDAEGLSATAQVSVNVQNTTSTTTTTSTPPPGSGSLDVWFKAPLASNTVSGILSGTKCYVNGTGVTKVAFKLDSTALNTDTVMADGMQCMLDTTKFPNGTHTLTATATSSTGATRSDVISINVQNSATTTTTNAAPSVSISSPASGATIAGTVAYSASAADDKAVARVVFSLDSTTLATLTAAPYGGSLNTTTLANGTHTLKAVAYDAEGLSSTSQISLNVQNSSASSGGSMPTDSTNVRGVATFQSIGMYWTGPGASATGCKMQFRRKGDSTWRDALDMWFDSRNSECRGSIVLLQPGTQYEVQMGLPGQSFKKGLTVATWSEQLPIAQTITLPATSSDQLTISTGGTPNGYVLYQAAPGGSTIDVANAKQYNVLISAPYVIVRGLTLKNAQIDGIRILPGAHDVVIEDNDISGWGRSGGWTTAAGWPVGMDRESGIRCVNASAFERGIIQRNKIHDPRYGANSWDWGHPLGPQGITFSYCGGNHVIRYNEIYSTTGQQHWYNDGISGEDNFSAAGFPNYDTDIYGNVISETWDDAIEAEGGGKNVRVFGNYTNNTNTGVASTVVDKGPLYVFRNVHNRSRAFSQRSLDSDDRNNAYKSGEAGGYGGGRRYMLHNTLLQATQSGAVNGLGMGGGIAGNTNQPLTNTVSRNNILHVWKSNAYSVYSAGGSGNDVNYDLRNGAVNISGGELNGLVGTPTYASGNGWQSESGGNYRLSSSSLGYGKALRLPNFNDAYSAPDVGAHQSGLAAMSFGVSGDPNFWVTGAPTGTASADTTSTTTTSSTSTTSTTTLLGPVAIPQ